MRMHFFDGRASAAVGGQDSKAAREGNVEYWKRAPWSVPYGESGGGGGLMARGGKLWRTQLSEVKAKYFDTK